MVKLALLVLAGKMVISIPVPVVVFAIIGAFERLV